MSSADPWTNQGPWEPHLLLLPNFPHSKSCPWEHRQDLTYILQLVGKARVLHLNFAGSWEEELFFSSGFFLSSFCKKKKNIQSCAGENFTGLKKEFGAKTRTRACRMGMNNVITFDLRLQRTLLHPMKDQV